MATPRISVVVLTHQRADEVLHTLARLSELTERPVIIVVDNASTDGTAAQITARFPSVRVVQAGTNLGAAGRNLGVQHVASDYVAFCDDDMWWERDSLSRAVALLDAHPQVGVLSARVVVGADDEVDPTCLRMLASPLDSAGSPGPVLIGYMAGACVFRTALFRQVGGYEPRLFIGGEEELVAIDVLEAGYRIVYCERIIVHHHPSPARDSGLRRRLLARNAACVGWLRLPWLQAVRATFVALRLFAREGTLRGDGYVLLKRLMWAMSRRTVASPRTLAMRSQVEESERRASIN